MKNIVLLKLIFACYLQQSTLTLQAQILYGTKPRGESGGTGTINAFDVTTNKLTVVKSFESSSNETIN